MKNAIKQMQYRFVAICETPVSQKQYICTAPEFDPWNLGNTIGRFYWRESYPNIILIELWFTPTSIVRIWVFLQCSLCENGHDFLDTQRVKRKKSTSNLQFDWKQKYYASLSWNFNYVIVFHYRKNTLFLRTLL